MFEISGWGGWIFSLDRIAYRSKRPDKMPQRWFYKEKGKEKGKRKRRRTGERFRVLGAKKCSSEVGKEGGAGGRRVRLGEI